MAYSYSPYTREQVLQFLDYIELPKNFHHAQPSLGLLQALHVHMLSTVPYENLTLHYSPSHTITLDPQHLYQKIVVNARGRGGYCMENTQFYNHVLRGLGFDSYTVGVRIRHRLEGVPQGGYSGYVHIVCIVTVDGSRHMVDVGFGGDCATKPMPLVEGLVHDNIGTQQIRLVRDWISTQTHRTEHSKLWMYQYRNAVEKDWNSYYAFSELEFMAPDWDIINWYTGSCPESFQTFTVLVIKFLRRRRPTSGQHGDSLSASSEEIYGKRMVVNGTIKENLGGKTYVVQECKTEEERVLALEKYFGIRFTEEEKVGIKGWATALA